MKNYYTQKFKIRVDEVDVFNRMKVEAIFKYLQEVATLHAELLENGREQIKQYGVVWVLSRISLNISSYPSFEQEFTIETWPGKPKKFMFPRYFRIKDSNDKIIGEATSIWTLLNFNTRSVELNPQYIKFSDIPIEELTNVTANKINFDETLTYQQISQPILYSDLDVNRHVNNVSYIKWTYDLMKVDYLEKHVAKTIDINYLNELDINSCVTLDYYYDDTQLIIRGISNNNVSFIAKISWEEKE